MVARHPSTTVIQFADGADPSIQPGRDSGLRGGRRPVTHGGAGATVTHRDHLGHDREGRLGRFPAAQVQADGAAEPGKVRGVDTGRDEPLPSVDVCVFRLPTAPTYRQPRARAVTIAGSSNLTSCVSTATASRGPRPIVVRQLVWPAEQQLVGVGEAFTGGEGRPAIDDHGLVAQGVRDGHERDGHLHRAHDDQPRSNAGTPR